MFLIRPILPLASRLTMLPVLLMAIVPALAEDTQRPGSDPAAVREVREGQRETANAAWWGFNAEDATDSLQAAIDSGAEKVIVPDMGRPWVVRPIQLASDQTVVFADGVVVEAKRGAYHGKSDSLFTARNLKNVTLRGEGATWRMHKDDYQKPPYEPSQWRHALRLRGSENVDVGGLTIKSSGGDGIYVGRGVEGGPVACRDIHIHGVKCLDHHRQGISVISVRGLLIENTVLRGTEGHAPAAGIDFEPNHADEPLTDCVMSDCVIEENAGRGIQMYLVRLDQTSPPVELTVRDSTIRNNNEHEVGVIYRGDMPGDHSFVHLENNRIRGHILVKDRPDESSGRFQVRIQQ